MRKPLFFIAVIWLSVSCGHHQHRPGGTFDLKALEGTWEFHHEGTHEIAQWKSDGKGGLRGNGFVLDNTDTTFIEFLSIESRDSTLVYYASASAEDSHDRVPFYLDRQSEESIEFFNAKYGFPQRIVYTLTSDTTIFAYIEGPQEGGKKVRINFNYQKRKES